MESSSFNYVVKGFASDESLLTADAFDKDQIGSMSWEAKAPFIYRNNLGLFPNDVTIDNQVFGEMGLPPLMRNYLFNSVMAATQNAVSEENQSRSNLESNSRESGLFDRKLGMLVDQREAQIFNASKIAHNLSPSDVSMPSKRPRVGGFGSSTPCCQVHGCNKNLSSFKAYHKRHRVCEVHSKTAKVIVNGIEQRFCQQCSRFHLLGEFDDGKRSCRKRLAGHNERRRKPHVGVLSGRHRRLLPSYNISIEGTRSSFLFTNALRTPYQHKYEPNGRCELNLEDGTAHDLQSISSITDEQLHSDSLSPCNFEKNSGFGIINRYVGLSSSASTVQGPSGTASVSESAPSLLSSQSRTSCRSSRTHMSNSQSHPFVFPGSNYDPTQDWSVA